MGPICIAWSLRVNGPSQGLVVGDVGKRPLWRNEPSQGPVMVRWARRVSSLRVNEPRQRK